MNPSPSETLAIDSLLSLFTGEFMRPAIFLGDFAELQNEHGELSFVPSDCFSPSLNDGETTQITLRNGILLRLSASGYMDCTEWEPCDNWQEVIARLTEWSEEIETDNAEN